MSNTPACLVHPGLTPGVEQPVKQEVPNPSQHGTTPRAQDLPQCGAQMPPSSTAECSPAGQKQNLHKGCQGCNVSVKCPAGQRAARCPASPWRSVPAELHPCIEGKQKQDKGKLGKTNRHSKKACRLIICSLLCNSNLMHPKCRNASNLPSGSSTQQHSPNKTPGAHQAEKAYVGI